MGEIEIKLSDVVLRLEDPEVNEAVHHYLFRLADIYAKMLIAERLDEIRRNL
jgi:hypothetical protein